MYFDIFSIFPVMFFIVAFLILCTIIFRLVSTIRQNQRNNASPVLTVSAKVVCKRMDVHRHHHHHHHNISNDSFDTFHTSSTDYFVTFEVESGDRIELPMSGNEYGLLVEGDYGMLTFQGTRYLNFKRVPHQS